jgi:hypothetical protein
MGRELSPQKQWVLKQMIFEDVLNRLDEHFTKLQIEYMLIKGAWFIKRGLAEKFASRRMRDIDLLVCPQDMPAVKAYFRQLPQCTEKQNYWPFEFSFFFATPGGSIYVEIHEKLNYEVRFRLPAADLLHRAAKKENFCVLVDDTDALVITICHQLVHMGVDTHRGFMDDIRVLFNYAKPDERILYQRVRGAGVVRFAQLVCFLALERWPFTDIKKPGVYVRLAARLYRNGWYDKAPEMVRRVLWEFGFYRN